MGDRLAKARRYAGIDQADMARRLHLNRNTIGNYENDRTGPRGVPYPVLVAWAAECGVTVAWLLGDTENVEWSVTNPLVGPYDDQLALFAAAA